MVRYIISTSDEFYNKKEISAKKWRLSVENKKNGMMNLMRSKNAHVYC